MRVYLDANALILAVEGEPTQASPVQTLMERIRTSDHVLLTSQLSLAEVLVRPLQVGDRKKTDRYVSIMSAGTGLTVAEVDRSVIIEAAELRAEYRSLKLPDAIHLATASLQGCHWLVSGDRRLPKLSGINRVGLGETDIGRLLEALP